MSELDEIAHKRDKSITGARACELAAAVFRHLVPPSMMKVAHTPGDLVSLAELPPETLGEVEEVLELLSSPDVRVLRPVQPPLGQTGLRYEIFHDVLAPAVLAWRERYLDERRRVEVAAAAERRLMRFVKILVWAFAVILTVVVLFAIYSGWKRQEVEAANAELRETQQKLQENYAEVEKGKRALEEKNNALVITQGELTKTIDNLNKTNESLILTKNSLTAEVEERKKSEAKLDAVNKEIEKQKRELQKQNNDLRKTKAALEDARTELVAANDELKNQKEEVDRQNVILAESERTIRAQYETLEKTSRALKESNQRLNVAQEAVEDVDKHTPYYAAIARIGTKNVSGATLTNDGGYIVGPFFDPKLGDKVGFWDVNNNRLLRLPSGPGKAGAFSPDGRYVVGMDGDRASVFDCGAAIGLDGKLRDECTPMPALSGPAGKFSKAAFDAEGKHVALLGEDARIRVWETSEGKAVGTPLEQKVEVNAIALSSDGALVASAGSDNVVRVWNVKTGDPGPEMRGHKKPIYSVAFNQGGDHLVTASADGTAIVWNVSRGKATTVLRTHRELIIKKKKGKFPIYFNVTQEPRPPLYSAAFSHQGNFVVTGDENGSVRVWDVKSNTEVRRLNGHYGPVISVSFSRDGLIISASVDKTVRVWNPCENEPQVYLGRIGTNSGRARFTCKYCAVYGKDIGKNVCDVSKK